MRKLFSGYYRPTKEEFDELWEKCIFSFDTNVLLHLYRYTPETRDRLLDILNAFKERIWIPHQVAYEYQAERLGVITQQLKPYEEINNLLDENLKKLISVLHKYKNRYSFVTFIEPKSIIEPIEEATKRVQKELQDAKLSHPDFLENDEFLEVITKLLTGKVGESYSEEKLEKIYEEAEKRFRSKKPPGYEDVKKPDPERYGDVVLWCQLIDYAKSLKRPLIFVTDDEKEDWWRKHEGKTIGPRPELVQEMLTKAGVCFYMYTTDRFINYAEDFLKLPDQKEAIEEAKEVRLQDAAQHISKETRRLLNILPDVSAVAQLAAGINSDILAALQSQPGIGELMRRTSEEVRRSLSINLDILAAAQFAAGINSDVLGALQSQPGIGESMRRLADLPKPDLPKLPSEPVRKLRGILKDIAPERGLVDELIQERREEANRE